MFILILLEVVAILIPLAGMIDLLRNKQHSTSTIRLMLTSIACVVMNSGALLMATAQNESEASMAAKFEYLGNALFYYFFVSFLIAYLRLKISPALLYLWAAYECAIVGIDWIDSLRELCIGHYQFIPHETFGVFTAQIEQSKLFFCRNMFLIVILTYGLFLVTFRMFRNQLPSERRNLRILACAQFIILVSFMIQMLLKPKLEIMPFFASLSLLSVVVSMLTDGFFGATDMGHEWVFRQMDNPYIITDNQYGFLDANEHAKCLFPELLHLRSNERIPERLHTVFTANTTQYEIGHEVYERIVTEIEKKGQIVGFGLLLENVTEQQKYVKLLNQYTTQLRTEVWEKTAHIQKVQNSIIAGMASMVESRDNSTGGHINRTSRVVGIFVYKLLQCPDVCNALSLTEDFLHNISRAAPMHDLGKIAVDDGILRKPDKFTDEEYAEMQKHPAEGARILKEVLKEVDNEEFVRIAVNVAHYHHERWDGKGYPEHIAGEDIPVEARIMALADVFDALVSKRCYKEGFTYDRAFSIIADSLGTQFDPVLGRVFLMCRPELEALYTLHMQQN